MRTWPFLSSGTFNTYSAVGYIKSVNTRTTGTITRNNCNYEFSFGANGGVVEQDGVCGDVVSLKRNYPTEQSIESDYDVSPVSDTSFSAQFYKVGGEFAWTSHHWHSRIGLYYQHTDRGVLDQRIANRQQPGFRHNHTAFTETTRTTRSGWAFGARLEYQRRQFLDTAPMLYTTFTSHRFERDVLLLTLNLHYALD